MTMYGLLIGIGIVISLELLQRRYNLFSYIDILFISLSALIGARALFLLHNIEEISKGTIQILDIRDGGLAFYGGLLGILISLFIISKIKKVHILNLTDKLFVFLPLMQSIGRLGNYFNNELYGKPSTLPWSIYIPLENRLHGYEQYTNFHPVFIYESILNFLLFLFLYVYTKKEKRIGIPTGIYLIGYSIIRICMNRLRIDKEYFLGIETSDLFSIIFFIVGIMLITNIQIISRKK